MIYENEWLTCLVVNV